MRGHTESVPLEELVALGRRRGLMVLDDIGSGAMIDFEQIGFTDEPLARDSIAKGTDLVLFSGDKLLGGPQAGIIGGRKELISKIERDDLMRAFRLDKIILAALEATLRAYLHEPSVKEVVPVLNMLTTPLSELRQRAEAVADRLRQIAGLDSVGVSEDVAFVGGGSLPDQTMNTWVVVAKARDLSDETFVSRLRAGDPSVMGRVHDGKVVLDVRTIFPEQIELLIHALTRAVQP
jgi:L-seryl-tRNA(Ser) seleniumtransferase